MREVRLPVIGTVATWRHEARLLAVEGVPSDEVLWHCGEGSGDLFADGSNASNNVASSIEIRLSKVALSSIQSALCHSDPERFARAYDVVLRLSRGDVRWGDRSDAGVRRILEQAKAVGRDIHKMHAFVRFRELPSDCDRRGFAAWFEPEHNIVEAATPFFAKRFGDMDWMIVTPTITAQFFDGTLAFAETTEDARLPKDDTEDLWRTYYASIFNPARLMVKAMTSEMPKKYWKNLPEADLIPELIRTAPERAAAMEAARPTSPPARAAAIQAMAAKPSPFVPAPGSPEALRRDAAGCTRCPLYRPATQAVFGEGPPDADVMIVGEQPGDREDLVGRPFVGPAGELFDEVAASAGLHRSRVYITNAVKHFKFKPQGKRRIHQRPNTSEIEACRRWLDHERQLIRPKLIVAMGATALQSLTGSGDGLLNRRGRLEQTQDGTPLLVTLHPSYILRLKDRAAALKARSDFQDDLAAAASFYVADSGMR